MGMRKTERTANVPELHRLHIILPARTFAEASALARKRHCSMTELVRLGLGLARIAADVQARHQKLVITDKDGKQLKELIFPGL
jgi:hypothetical protein